MEKIGRKQKVSLKTIFPDGAKGGEAHDWTPSLFNNEQGILDDLIKCTGVDIDPIEIEYIVWDKLRIDILANNTNTGNKIIIENQFGVTDDSHFSRIMKYRAGINKLDKIVDTIIWIVEDADDATIEVVRDLNDHYDDVNFFIVKMEAEEDVDTHCKYVNYEQLVRPNILIKEAQINKRSDNTEQAYIAFWKYFREKLKLHPEIDVPGLRKEINSKGYPEKWCVCPWQLKGEHSTHYLGLKNTNKKLQVVYGTDSKDDKSVMEILSKNVDGVNSYTTTKHLIAAENTSEIFSMQNQEQWDTISNWFIQNIPVVQSIIEKINAQL